MADEERKAAMEQSYMVVEFVLTHDDVFREELHKMIEERLFTIPALKVGFLV